MAAMDAGHSISGLVGRDRAHLSGALEAAQWNPDVPRLGVADPIPACDLFVIAVRDSQIADVVALVAQQGHDIPAAVHLSGLGSIDLLRPLAAGGASVGVFHPLQTLPTPRVGADRLSGAWAGITAFDDFALVLEGFATSLGMHAFRIADEQKALYHAAAAAAANFPLATLAMAEDLFAAAGVPLDAAQPLVDAVVANAFALGPRAALTGPVARGDVRTVQLQLEAVAESTPEWLPAFASFVAELARLTGRGPQFAAIANDLGGDQ